MKTIYNFCCGAIKFIALAVTVILFVMCISNKVYIPQNHEEYVYFMRQPAVFYILLPVFAVCILLLKKLIDKIPAKLLFILLALVYLAAGLYLIANVDATIRADAKRVFLSALEINAGDYTRLQREGYMYIYPNNLGAMTFYRVLTKINAGTKFAFLANLILIIITNFFIYRTAAVIFESDIISKYTMIFSFIFMPQFFFILFVYGTVPGFACVTAMVYFTACSIKYNNNTKTGRNILGVIYILAVFVFASAAILLKNNYMIAVLAILIIFVIRFVKKQQIISIVMIAVLAVAMIVPQKALISYYEKLGGEDITGAPSILWLAMGMQDSQRAPGWYTAFNDNVFRSTGYDAEKASLIGRQQIAERVQYFIENPEYTAEFYSKKMISTWCEYTCQSLWTGPLETVGQYKDTEILRNIYNEGPLYNAFYLLCSLVTACMLFFTVMFQLTNLRKEIGNTAVLFPLLFLVGGFMFHILWETKSQYIYMYWLMLAPLAASGVEETCRIIGQKMKK